jgi:hypothetical protein
MTFDDLRAAFPHLGFAVYAYAPGGEVTFEIHAPEGEVFMFKAASLDEAIVAAFPRPEPEPEDIFG